MRFVPILIEAIPGETIYCTTHRAIDRANEEGKPFRIRHNDTEVNVYPGSNRFDVVEKWAILRELQQLKGEFNWN